MGRPAVFLDRDGVLNEPIARDGRPYSPMSVEDFHLIDGAADACRALHDAGLALVVVTNQPEIARGTFAVSELDAMHAKLREHVPIDAIRVCPHDDADRCLCRKPRPGMILDAADELGLDVARSVVVGDRWRDIDAGQQAGCATVFIDRSWNERRPERPDAIFTSLSEATGWIVRTINSMEEHSV